MSDIEKRERTGVDADADGMEDTLRDPGDLKAKASKPPPAKPLPTKSKASTRPPRPEKPGKGKGDKKAQVEARAARHARALDDDDTVIDDDIVADPLIGLVVAERYRILERIGRGGMGIVYKVEHTRIGKLLAMKLLAGELSTNKEVVRRFKLEALTVSKLSSPYTVQVFDYGVWNHLTYLVMELVDGQDLSRPLKQTGPLPFSRLGRLMVHVCTSLAEAHQKGITHRDIKPENIMIATDPRGVEVAKVLDFGLAKLRENAELNEVTLQGAVVGTPYFMSPEQVYGDDVDGRTDIYSLGAVMFRALTGTYPFQAKSPMGMFTKHLTEEPPSAGERAPDQGIPKGVSDAIQKCMMKDAAKRFQNVEELRELLMEELSSLPLTSSERTVLDEPSGERMLDSDELRRQRQERVVAAVDVAELAKTQFATRRELEDYESKLRRARFAGWAVLGILIGSGAATAGYLAQIGERFTGRELEPNDGAAEANELPLGRGITGYIGKRIEADEADRDFYHFQVAEADAHLALAVTRLPNIPLCALLYRIRVPQPIAQYCAGAPEDLSVTALEIEPGEYFVGVTQDMAAGNGARLVYENISDSYHLSVSLVTPSPTDEVESNDSLDDHQLVAGGGEVNGALSWVGDEDVYCLTPGHSAAISWEISDERRKEGAVLEATALVDGLPAPLARVHTATVKPLGKPLLDADVTSPWRSPSYASGARCLRLRLTEDPWSTILGPPRPDATRYVVRVLQGD